MSKALNPFTLHLSKKKERVGTCEDISYSRKNSYIIVLKLSIIKLRWNDKNVNDQRIIE